MADPKAPVKPSPGMVSALTAAFVAYSLLVGYFAGTRPKGEWRYFSWHPFLMICGLVGCTGIATVTKKLGGYTNTKNHGIIANVGVILAGAGFYVIYNNKNLNNYDHFMSLHAKFGLAIFVSCIGLGMVGGIVLHPDFGVDKTNGTIRYAHKMGARCVLAGAWMCCVSGMLNLTSDPMSVALVALPLAGLAPFVLV